MTKRRQFDLIVIGAEPAGFAAAGCAAREGARTALIRTGDKSLRVASMPGVPDFFRGGYRDLLHRIDTHDDEGDPLQMLYVMADFFRPDLDFFSRLLILPTASALARILNRL